MISGGNKLIRHDWGKLPGLIGASEWVETAPLCMVKMPWWFSKHPVLIWLPLHVMYICQLHAMLWANDIELRASLISSVTYVSRVNTLQRSLRSGDVCTTQAGVNGTRSGGSLGPVNLLNQIRTFTCDMCFEI